MACHNCGGDDQDDLIIYDGEGDSGSILITVRDENGDLVEKAAINSILLTLFRMADGEPEVINNRLAQGVLDANGGEYFDALQSALDANGDEVTYNFRWDYTGLDTPFLKDDDSPTQTETHLAQFRFTWDGGAKSKTRQVRMVITNYLLFEVA